MSFLEKHIDQLQAKGKYSFVLQEVLKENGVDKLVFYRAAKKLREAQKIVRVRQEFYVIVPPEYRNRGILPLSWYLDDLMSFLDRPYYLGLLNAAALHEAAHQQPQSYYVFTHGKWMRNIQSDKLQLKFIFKNTFPEKAIELRKTPTGYLNISSPELTCLDLVQQEKIVGGLSRVATILEELVEKVDPVVLADYAFRYASIPTVQRLGYLLDVVLEETSLAAFLVVVLERQKTRRILLKSNAKYDGISEVVMPWKVIPNVSVNSDL